MIARGSFREDLYYRLCSDQVTTPALSEQLAESPGVLRELVEYMSRRVAGAEGEELAGEVMQWIESSLGSRYTWPGNYRELEQCIKNVLIRRNYRPSRAPAREPLDELTEAVRSASLTADELLTKYVTVAYSRAGSYEETARRLGLDRRTVKARLDRALLERLRHTTES
jgi:transcriptional regulator of acetoin/glycerol metabolism